MRASSSTQYMYSPSVHALSSTGCQSTASPHAWRSCTKDSQQRASIAARRASSSSSRSAARSAGSTSSDAARLRPRQRATRCQQTQAHRTAARCIHENDASARARESARGPRTPAARVWTATAGCTVRPRHTRSAPWNPRWQSRSATLSAAARTPPRAAPLAPPRTSFALCGRGLARC